MKPLSAKQATNCEQAREHICKCRCGGLLHGAKRGGENPSHAFFESLPADDPHYIPSEAAKEAIRKEKLEAKKQERREQIQRRMEAIMNHYGIPYNKEG